LLRQLIAIRGDFLNAINDAAALLVGQVFCVLSTSHSVTPS